MDKKHANLKHKVVELANLPTLPGVLKHITKMTESKETSASDVAKVISTDQVLSAKVLRLVNSPIYGFPGRISSVTHAIVLLGFNVVKGLVLGTSVFDSLGDQGKALWFHSLGCAVISRRIAIVLGLPEPEEVMIGGLLHDLGKVVLAHIRGKEYEEAVRKAQANGSHIGLVETEVFGVDHTGVAAWLAEEWHFPPRLADPIVYHHRPMASREARQTVAAVHVADILARAMGYGDPGDRSMPPISRDAYQLLGISFAQIDSVLEEAEAEFVAGSQLFSFEG